MRPRSTDAIAIAPGATLSQYERLADALRLAAPRGGDALTEWARTWMQWLAGLQSNSRTPVAVDRDGVTRIERDVERSAVANAAGVGGEGSRLVVALLHGFATWDAFGAHVEDLGRPGSAIETFESAADAVVTGDITALDRLLTLQPSIVRDRSTRAHHATLLHYVAANGHEDFRQRTPPNAVDIARRLLESGAEPDALADMYDLRCTPMEMLVSSVHPHAAGVQVRLVHALIDGGAAVDGADGNGSPLMTAFRFGYPAPGRALAERGARIDHVLAAAALGRAHLLERFVIDGPAIREDVRLVDVPWPRLPRDPAVHLAYALTWAAGFGSLDAVEVLLRKGVPVDARDDDGTALHAAAARGRLDVMALLLRRGAPIEAMNRFDGTVLDGTLWHALNGPVAGVNYAAVVRALLDAGARTDLYPEMPQYVEQVLRG